MRRPAWMAEGYSTVPIIGSGVLPGPPCGLDAALRFAPFRAENGSWAEAGALPERSGGVMPLRAPSPEDDGRVKAWRKHARDGTLPPVLLSYFALVERWLVVDGHDRLHATLLEGREPPLLGLWSFTEFPMSCATATCIDSETCCVEAHPANPAACGLTDAEAAAILGAAVGGAATGAALSELDDPDEGWREHCIRTYVQCKDSKRPYWVGDCHACLRNCEGQRQWPFAQCHPRRRQHGGTHARPEGLG